ncbi:MAG: tetratricopeptide repeat protein [Devosia sp.]
MIRIFATALVLLASSSQHSLAGSLSEALEAHNRGDEQLALELLLPLAESGEIKAMDTLSHIYWWGDGVPPDHTEALKWSRRSAALGSSAGQHDLAIHYLNGDVVKKDAEMGASLYKMAAEQGDAHAKAGLGSLYLKGTGVPEDFDQGMALIRAAAEQGYYRAQSSLGVFLHNGAYGLPKDDLEAIRWLELAAEQGDVGSQFVVGLLYAGEAPQAVNIAKAAEWLAIAARAGCLQAANFGLLSVSMLPAGEAEFIAQRVDEWIRLHPRDIHRHTGPPPYCYGDGGRPI